MNKQDLLACVAAMVFCASADAGVAFTSVRYETTAVAVTADGPPGFDTQSALAAGDPLSGSAASVGTTDIATAGAIATLDQLTTSADASAVGLGSSVGTSRFTGAFVNSGSVNLIIDFTRFDSSSGSGGASTTLFLSLMSNGVSLFNDYVEGLRQFSYSPVIGTTSLLDLTLSSEASAGFLSAGSGNASSFGLVSITGTVPEPSAWLLVALGLGAIPVVKWSTRRKVQCA